MLVLGGARNRDTSTSPAAALLGGGVAKSWPPARRSPSRQLGSSGSDLEVVEMPFLVKRAKTLQKSLGWGLGQLPPSQAKPPEKKTQPPLPQRGRKELPGKEASAAGSRFLWSNAAPASKNLAGNPVLPSLQVCSWAVFVASRPAPPVPQRSHGHQGYHRTLKAVCLKKGAYASRTFLRIDINDALAQPIYRKIDPSFGEVFR